MPIKIPDLLPARSVLEGENIFVMTEHRAIHQDIRPLNVLILNLMPTKIVTETQILRKLSNTPLQVTVELLRTSSYQSQHTASDHLESFYTTFAQVRERKFDGMIITGAPVETLPFEEVDYWPELCRIMEWSRSHAYSTLHICWGAQAGLYYHYGIPKHPLPEKMFGIFAHHPLVDNYPLLRGFDEEFWAPHSRHTTVLREDIAACPQVQILAMSPDAGVYLAEAQGGRQIFVTGHSEYDRYTLADEYWRDRNKGLPISVPTHYYPDDDPTREPMIRWRGHANLLFSNWLNYYVYQETPYDLEKLSRQEE